MAGLHEIDMAMVYMLAVGTPLMLVMICARNSSITVYSYKAASF